MDVDPLEALVLGGATLHLGVILRLYWDNGKEHGNYRDYRGYIGINYGLYWGYIGIMEKKMETTI